jgi:hypothetical protein
MAFPHRMFRTTKHYAVDQIIVVAWLSSGLKRARRARGKSRHHAHDFPRRRASRRQERPLRMPLDRREPIN